MRLPAWAWLALSSALLLSAATRPRYGGTLNVEVSGAPDPMDLPPGIAPPVAETLVKLNSRAEIEPLLAVSWQQEAQGKRWRFSLRTKVVFHDGQPFNGPSAARALLAPLKKKYPDVGITAGGQTLVIQSESPLPSLLVDLADPRTAIVAKTDSSPVIGTGPFRVASWEPGRKLTLNAFDDYWGGRPFLDSVVITTGNSRSAADLFDLPLGSARRIIPEGTRIWSSSVSELVAIASAADQPALPAIALAIDRGPIVNVLTQRRGEPAFGLLPQWLTGYAFLFETAPDTARARQIVSGAHIGPLTLSYPPNDSFLKAVAERVALNARDGGLSVQPTPNSNGSLRMIRWHIESANATVELQKLTSFLGVPERAQRPDLAQAESLYQAERGLLETNRIVPLVHLPALYGMAPRVHNREATARLFLHLENLWVDP